MKVGNEKSEFEVNIFLMELAEYKIEELSDGGSLCRYLLITEKLTGMLKLDMGSELCHTRSL